MTGKNTTAIPLFILGFLTIGTQVCLFREMLVMFNGIEFTIAIAFSIWLLFSGAGARISSITPSISLNVKIIHITLLCLIILPFLLLPATFWIKTSTTPSGAVTQPLTIFGLVTVLFGPYCFLSGWLFSALSSVSGEKQSASKAYAIEAFGGITGAAAVSALLMLQCKTDLVLAGLASISLVALGWHFTASRVFSRLFLSVCIVCLTTAMVGWFYLAKYFENVIFPGQVLLRSSESPYGKLIITKSDDQLNFFQNGVLLYSSGNQISNEEDVHYAMAQHASPRRVLVISGAHSGLISEIKKYKPEKIDYIEIDPSLIYLTSNYTEKITGMNITPYVEDARTFLSKTRNRYDIILLNVPPPTSIQANRYFTIEFMNLVKKVMNPGAVLSMGLPAVADYIGGPVTRLTATVYQTAEMVFQHTLIVPANKNYLLCSDHELSMNFPKMIREKNIDNVYVNEYYLDTAQMIDRSGKLAGIQGTKPPVLPFFSEQSILNSDLMPLAVWNYNMIWLNFFQLKKWQVVAIILLIIIVLIVFSRKMNTALFTAGYTLASVEIILIYTLQLAGGSLYVMVSFLLMVFMMGSAMGAISGIPRRVPLKHLIALLLLAMLVPSGGLWLLLKVINRYHADVHVIYSCILVLAFLFAFLTSMIYQVTLCKPKENILLSVSLNYSSDLIGACLGALLVAFLFIPLAGIIPALLMTMVLLAVSAAVQIFR